MTSPSDLLRAKLNLETAQLQWPELERHFARGAVVKVAAGTDLVEAALHMVENNDSVIRDWMTAGRISVADMDDAQDWHTRNAVFWAVVVAPWVLVQEICDTPEDSA